MDPDDRGEPSCDGVRNATGIGEKNSLTFVIDYGNDVHHSKTHHGDNFDHVQAYVHHPKEIPDVSGETSLVLDLGVGRTTHVAISAEELKVSSAFKKLSFEERRCVIPGDRLGGLKLNKFAQHYRQKNPIKFQFCGKKSFLTILLGTIST